MNPITGFSFKANGVDYIITENWSSGNLTYANKETGEKHYSTVDKFKANESLISQN